MKNKESRLPDDWFNIADKDLKRVEIMLNADDLKELKNKILGGKGVRPGH